MRNVDPGERFGAWVVLTSAAKGQKHPRALCRCACGTDKPVLVQTLLSGQSTRCRNCHHRAKPRHGHARGYRFSPEYACWQAMKQRCSNPHNASYHCYGAVGVTVCARWLVFENFLADMGSRPSRGHTLHRGDGTKGYEPGNCSWATMSEQANGKRTNIVLEFGGKRQTVAQWARELGVYPGLIHKRLAGGWEVEQALTEPPRQSKKGQPRRLRR